MEFVKAALSTFALAWAASLWHKLDFLRERVGVYPVFDGQGWQSDRLDSGGLGGWLNCPLCAVVLMAVPGWLLRRQLAHLGLALLLMRWWESARLRREWWL